MRRLALASFLLFPAAARAGEFDALLDAHASALAALPPSGEACRAAYSKLDGKGPLRVAVFFGFIDTARKNYVADRDFKDALVRRLTMECRGSLQACGFVAAPDDPALPNGTRLTKTVGGREIDLEAFDSSLGPDYADDVRRRAAEQAARSELVERQYLDALTRDAAVLYTGHTRRFAGTGFYPPLDFTAGSAAVLARRPFFRRVADALRGSSSAPAVLGLFGCYSREYYAGTLHSAAPGAALVVSGDSSGHENSLLALYGGINALLARPCAAEVEKTFDAGPQKNVFHAYGLFDGGTHPRYVRYLDGKVVLIGLFLIPLWAFVSSGRWTKEISPPAPTNEWRTTGRMILLLVPAGFVARFFAGPTTTLPVLLVLLGWSSMAWNRSWRDMRLAAPTILVAISVYLFVNLVREASADNAWSAFRQAATFAAAVFLLLPFAGEVEEAHLAPLTAALWLTLCALAPVFKPKFWPLAAWALYARGLSFFFRSRRGRAASALASALTLALALVEGLHGLIYQ